MIYIGIPSRGLVFSETINAVIRATEYVSTQVQVECTSPVSAARNNLVNSFLNSRADYLLMLDDDEVMPDNAMRTMLNANSPVVVIDAPSKRTGKSNIFRNKDGSIAATGFGCALFTRKVFEAIPEPWFDLKPWRILERVNGNWRFPILHEDKANPWGGEDINFCLKLHEHGFKIVDVPGLICTHLEYDQFTTENRATQLVEIKRYDEITRPPL